MVDQNIVLRDQKGCHRDRLLEVIKEVLENSVREADRYLTIDPDTVDELLTVVNGIRCECGRRPIVVEEDSWPGLQTTQS